MAEIKIDSKLFQERISHFVTAWKNDLRTKDGLFGGASSMVVMMGKVEEIPELHKNNAIHVCDPFSSLISYMATRNTDENDSFGFLDTSSRRL